MHSGGSLVAEEEAVRTTAVGICFFFAQTSTTRGVPSTKSNETCGMMWLRVKMITKTMEFMIKLMKTMK